LKEPYLARRDHPSLHRVMKQYDPMKPLLFSHDPPVSAEAVVAAKKQMNFAAALNQPTANDAGSTNGKEQKEWQEMQVAWNVSANSAGSTAPTDSKQNGSGQDAGSWQNGGSSWSGGWKNKESWKHEDSWKSGDWKKDEKWQGGDWKNESNGQKGQSGASKSQSNANDDDEDAWGGWSAPVEPKQKAPAAGEPALKRPRIEVPPHIAQQAPHTPPKALAFMSGQLQPSGFRRMESRSQPGIFYYFNETTNETRVEPPPPWEKKESRSQAGVFYYWNTVTCETSVVKPVV